MLNALNAKPFLLSDYFAEEAKLPNGLLTFNI
jgi:hypothetical protein